MYTEVRLQENIHDFKDRNPAMRQLLTDFHTVIEKNDGVIQCLLDNHIRRVSAHHY